MSLVPTGKKITAGVCGIFLGYLGLHKFVMGFPKAGLTMLAAWAIFGILAKVGFPLAGLAFSAVFVVGFVEGIIYLVKNDQDFYRDYVIRRQEWF